MSGESEETTENFTNEVLILKQSNLKRRYQTWSSLVPIKMVMDPFGAISDGFWMGEEIRANQKGEAITRKTIGWIVLYQKSQEDASLPEERPESTLSMKSPKDNGEWTLHNITLELAPSANEIEDAKSSSSTLLQSRGYFEQLVRSSNTKERPESCTVNRPKCKPKLPDPQSLPDVVDSTLEIQSSKCKLLPETSSITTDNRNVFSLDPQGSQQGTVNNVLLSPGKKKNSNSCLNQVSKNRILASLRQDQPRESLPMVPTPSQTGLCHPSLTVTYHSRSDLLTFCKAQESLGYHDAMAARRKQFAMASMRRNGGHTQEYSTGVPQGDVHPRVGNACSSSSQNTLPELKQPSLEPSRLAVVRHRGGYSRFVPTVTFGSFQHSSPDGYDREGIDPSIHPSNPHNTVDSSDYCGSYLTSYLKLKSLKKACNLEDRQHATPHSVVGHSSVIHCSSPRPPKVPNGGDPLLCVTASVQDFKQKARDNLVKLTTNKQDIIKGIRSKARCRYPDPLEGANSRFCKRISELSILVSQTVRWENHKSLKNLTSKSCASTRRDKL